jgi:ribosomal protein S3AE
MLNLEEITIKVSPEIAQAYRRASQKDQEQIQLKIMALLQSQMISSHQEKIKKLRETMDKASEEAQANGLTPEILEEILAETNE